MIAFSGDFVKRPDGLGRFAPVIDDGGWIVHEKFDQKSINEDRGCKAFHDSRILPYSP
jgi:hypothetical protein